MLNEVTMLENAKKGFRKIFIGFIIFTVVMIGLIILIYALPFNENLRISLIMLIMLLIIVGIVMLRPRLMFQIEQIKFYRLKAVQGPMLQGSLTPESDNFSNRLIQEGFKSTYKSELFTMYTSYKKDSKQFYLKRPMLMVYVIIHQPQIGFQDKGIVREINRFEDSLYKNKKRVVNYTVYIAKSGATLTPNVKEACDYITFSKVGQRFINNINMFYETKSKSWYFLYSNEYAPNSYYRFAIDYLKKFIS